MAVDSATNKTSSTGSTTTNNSLSSQSVSSSEASDRFLKLLVTQMQNQDPLNPLDNAQVTSQMAQISTVTGLETLNSTVGGLNSQFLQLQTMQGAALVGHEVAYEDNSLKQADGKGSGGFEISSAADEVKVEIQAADGSTVDTLTLKNLEPGRHEFDCDVPASREGTALTFKITATAKGKEVDSMPLQTDKITAVSTFNNTMALELSSGERVAYDAVWAFL